VKHKPEVILEQISRIQQMERGKLCRMRRGPTGDYYNHQTWEKGGNVVRYVARDQVDDLKNAIAGYQLFLKLTQAYAEEVIRHTRLARKTKT
jgi:hypothetical protein